MRKIMRNVALMTFALAALVGCTPELDVVPEFSVDDIYGKWRSGSEYYRYDSDFYGVTWNTADDVTEAEGKPFKWEIVGVDMTHIHIAEMDFSAPKTYVIDELTPSVLRYHDAYGKDYQFYKVDY